MRRPQFTLRAVLVLMLAVACFFGGVRFERERRRRADDAAAQVLEPLQVFYFEDLRSWKTQSPPEK